MVIGACVSVVLLVHWPASGKASDQWDVKKCQWESRLGGQNCQKEPHMPCYLAYQNMHVYYFAPHNVYNNICTWTNISGSTVTGRCLDEVVDKSLCTCLGFSTYPCMHHASFVFLNRSRNWTHGPINKQCWLKFSTHNYNQEAFAFWGIVSSNSIDVFVGQFNSCI